MTTEKNCYVVRRGNGDYYLTYKAGLCIWTTCQFCAYKFSTRSSAHTFAHGDGGSMRVVRVRARSVP